jgi:hypothetical protein
MNKFNKILKSIDFIEYISKPMEERDILLILKINGFTVERGGLLLDFVESIVQKITKTYLGDDLMSTEDKRKHFDWCWSSVLSDFSKENIFFNKKGHLYEYFLSFFNEIFYLEQNKEEKRLEKTLYFIINSFNYKRIRTKSEVDGFLDLYKIFNKSFGVSL